MFKKAELCIVIGCILLVGTMGQESWAAGGKKTLTIAIDHMGSEVWWPPYTSYESFISQSVGDGLVRIISPYQVEPLLATEWKVDPKGLRWEFLMRDDAYFSDGTRVTPEDMKYTLEQRQKYMGYSGLKQYVTSIETQGNRLIINLSTPTPQMLDNYFSWLAVRPKALLEKIGGEKFNKNPIGCGPFKFVKHVKGEYVKLEKNEKYYGKKPEVDEVTFKIVQEPSTRIAMLRTGEADITFNESGPNVAELNRYRFKAVPFGWPVQDVIFFNRLKKAGQKPSKFSDKRVREAILYATNRDSMAKAFYHGLASAGGGVTIVGKGLGSPPYNKNYDTYPYNPNKAKQLLAEAGQAKGLEMELRTVPPYKDLATAIASDLKQVGITVNLNIWDVATYVNHYYKHLSEDDFAYLGLLYATGPASYVYIDPKAMVSTYVSPETDLREKGDAVVGHENQVKWMHDVLIPALYKAQGVLPLIERPYGVVGLGPKIKNWPKMDGHSLGLEFVEKTE
jgi:peptide/nickel transport system substrate-binding protein